MTTTMTQDILNQAFKISVEESQEEIINFLIEKNPTNLEECAKIASNKNNFDVVELILDKLGDKISSDCLNYIFLRTIYCDSNLFKSVLKKNPTNLDEGLKLAVKRNNLSNVQLIVEKMKPVKIEERVSFLVTTNLSQFEIEGKYPITQLIIDVLTNPEKALADLESGVATLKEINYIAGCFKQNVVHYLCFYWSELQYAETLKEKLLDKLIECGAHFLLTNDGGSTPLAMAIENNYTTCVKNLLKHYKDDSHVIFNSLSDDISSDTSEHIIKMLLARLNNNVKLDHTNAPKNVLKLHLKNDKGAPYTWSATLVFKSDEFKDNPQKLSLFLDFIYQYDKKACQY